MVISLWKSQRISVVQIMIANAVMMFWTTEELGAVSDLNGIMRSTVIAAFSIQAKGKTYWAKVTAEAEKEKSAQQVSDCKKVRVIWMLRLRCIQALIPSKLKLVWPIQLKLYQNQYQGQISSLGRLPTSVQIYHANRIFWTTRTD